MTDKFVSKPKEPQGKAELKLPQIIKLRQELRKKEKSILDKVEKDFMTSVDEEQGVKAIQYGLQEELKKIKEKALSPQEITESLMS